MLNASILAAMVSKVSGTGFSLISTSSADDMPMRIALTHSEYAIARDECPRSTRLLPTDQKQKYVACAISSSCADKKTMASSSLAIESEEGEAAMKEKAEHARKTAKQATTLERGINLDVLGRAIIAQADERIRWHKRTAGVMEAELNAMTMKPGAPASSAEDWKQVSRRTDLQSKIDGHLEYAPFLDFIRQNIIRNRRYRLGLTDLSMLEIMPKGTYW